MQSNTLKYSVIYSTIVVVILIRFEKYRSGLGQAQDQAKIETDS